MERSSRPQHKESEVLEGKVYAILAYLSILCIIPLIVKKENAFVLFHGKQGLVLFVGEVAVFIGSIIIPWLFKPGMFILFVLSFLGILAVLQGKSLKLPVITSISEKITL